LQLASSFGSLQAEHVPLRHRPLTPLLLHAESFAPVHVLPPAEVELELELDEVEVEVDEDDEVDIPPLPLLLLDVDAPPVPEELEVLDELAGLPVELDALWVPPVPVVDVPPPQPVALTTGIAASVVVIRRCR
jgi:hypothetical protein